MLTRTMAMIALTLMGVGRVEAACRPGIYGDATGFLVIGPGEHPRWLFADGRRGGIDDPASGVGCDGDIAALDGGVKRWPRMETRETPARFESAATMLSGTLIEPPGAADPKRPLVVMVHGSEKTRAVETYAYMLAAQGIAAFVYDKRGTGASDGEYTQNFALLADDAAAALATARRLAAGRFGRSGFYGGSQGGWIAPLAATRIATDFVAVGFGLTVSPIEEDRAQLLDEARAMHLDPAAIAGVERLAQATAALQRSHFRHGFEALEDVRRSIGGAPWATTIAGEYSGDMLRMSDPDLRRIGRARFDNLEIIWDYDSRPALERLDAPLLWVLAGDDREAPIGRTRAMLAALQAEGRPIDVYLFPGTDHGMVEYRTNADGSRTATRITPGYLTLLADWIRGDVHGAYGRAERLSVKGPSRPSRASLSP